MAAIVFIKGPLTGQIIQLDVEKPFVIGRSDEADLKIADPAVSSLHARIHSPEGTWTVEDLDSSNGTMVNGSTIVDHPLRAGDRVEIGDSVFRFEPDGAGPEPQAGETIVPERPEIKVVQRAARIPDTKASPEDVERVRRMGEKTGAIRAEVAKVIVGQREVVDQVLMCLIAGGHGLLIGLPGMAKTLLVSTIARVLDLAFKRIQFTPDLMPSDITGTEVLETNKATGEKEFRFVRGPIFCNLLLADEINRTPPKTQAALLEAMQEKMVTAGNVTYELDEPFYVLATQNPIEQEGTYPLPEAQLDRFMFNIWVDYPLEDEEEEIVSSTTAGNQVEPKRALSKEEVLDLRRIVRQIPVSPHVVKYVIKLVRSTRPAYEQAPEVTRKYVSTGAGPRAGQFLVLAGKARAALEGRIHVSCSDIRRAAIPVLRHRILTNFAADSEGRSSMDIVKTLLEEIPEPDEKDYLE